uniref:Ig-like domain-containing protein n=1 Tax=Romanomermis culicivorax TaxID=13658 RepID=A0A915IIJ2_ROMCU
RIYSNFFTNHVPNISGATKILRKTFVNPGRDLNVGQRFETLCDVQHDSNLEVNYTWLVHGREIRNNPNVHYNGPNLTIAYSTGSDSGFYTCIARTKLDSVNSTIKVIIRDVPPPPKGVQVKCENHTARVSFLYEDRFTDSIVDDESESDPDRKIAATSWILQYNVDPTEPDAWETYPTELTRLDQGFGEITMHLFPYGNFSFRTLAKNSVGLSMPEYPALIAGAVGGRCVTSPARPWRNPDHVQIVPNDENSLIINWELPIIHSILTYA